MASSDPLKLCLTASQELMERLLTEAQDYAVAHGMMIAPPDSSEHHGIKRRFATAPSTLVPTAFPRKAYESGLISQQAWLKLLDRVSRDREFLTNALASTCAVDSFTAQLMHVYDIAYAANSNVYQEGTVFLILRNDYMLHQDEDTSFSECTLRHVESNTIAVSLGCLSTKVHALQTHLLANVLDVQCDVIKQHLPANLVSEKLADGFKVAHDQYLEANPWTDENKRNVKIAMIIHQSEFNAFDQRHLEYILNDRHGIAMIRVSLGDVYDYGKLLDNGRLVVRLPAFNQKETEISVAYFRAGYGPQDYTDPKAWEARKLLELSAAIKCPNIASHLAGTKKVQQVLSQPNVLERFLDTEEEIVSLTSTFAKLYSLDAKEYSDKQHIHSLVQEASEYPQRYVLKPQREGGGSNLYGVQAAAALANMDDAARAAFILQERIHPPIQRALVVGDKNVGVVQDSSTELGLFGISVFKPMSDSVENLVNPNAGFLLRTKSIHSDEGGFARGLGVVDVLWLQDQ